MDDKKMLILVGAGLLLIMMSNKKQVANGTLATANNAISSLPNIFGSLFSGSKNTGQPSLPYGGKAPTAATTAAAAAASNADQNPDLNGSISDYAASDGLPANPVYSSAYDYSKQFWY